MSRILITCAITGSIHTPSMSPHLPVTAEEIARQSIAAAEAGAAILHLHARDPETGRPSSDPAHFMAFLPRIKQASGAVLNITTGGSATMTLDERLAATFAHELPVRRRACHPPNRGRLGWRRRSGPSPKCAASTWDR